MPIVPVLISGFRTKERRKEFQLLTVLDYGILQSDQLPVGLIAQLVRGALHQGRVVQKPVNANPGLKVNRGNNFSCIKVLSIAYVLCSLR